MKQLMGTWAILFISLFSIAQAQKLTITGTIKGTVKDASTNKPLSGAFVKLENSVVITNEEGKFLFTKLSKNKYGITINSIGYREKNDSIELKNVENNFEFALIGSPLFLQPLEVKALRATENAPFAKTNISKEQLAKTNLGQDLPFMLQQTPSTVINSDAGNGVGYTNIYIRGVDASRINVTLNGIPYNDAESQGSFFVNLPDLTSSLNSIQIQRGVGSSSNGTGAFGAGINLQTNEFNEKAYAEFNNSYGSFNTLKNTIKVGSGLVNNHFTVDARLSRIKSDGFIDRASSDLQSFAVSAAYTNKTSSVRLNILSGKEKTYQAWYGVPEEILPTNRTYNSYTYLNQTDNYQQNHYQLFLNHSFNKKITASTAFFFTPGKGYFEEYLPSTYYAYFNLPDKIVGTDTISQTDLVRQRWLDNKFYGQIGSIQYKTDKDQLILGGGWSKYEGYHYGNIIWAKEGGVDKDFQYYNNLAVKGDENIYLKWEHQLTKKWQFYADAQYKYVFHRMNGFDGDPTRLVSKEFYFFNPKIGITYHYNGWQAFASYSVANKEPNRTDFENGIKASAKAEHLNDFELGFEKKGSFYSIGATFYAMEYKDQLVLTGKLNDAGYPIRINTPNSFRRGIELQAAFRIAKWVNFSSNLTLSSNRIKNFTEYFNTYDANYYPVSDSAIAHSNTSISFSPTTIAATTINFIPCQYFEISLLSKYVSKQYLDNTQNEARVLGSYFTQDIRVISTIPEKWFKSCNLILQVNNVFNRKYESNGATYPGNYDGYYSNSNYYFPMAGTNFLVGMNIKL